MTRAQYRVSPNGLAGWKIRLVGRDFTGYRTQAEAIASAVHMAYRRGHSGDEAQVIVQRPVGDFRTEWTYGHDAYPPRGPVQTDSLAAAPRTSSA